nr:hypothetical protein [Tanacetum cinerariifolium]
EIDTDHEDEAIATANNNKSSIFHFPHLLLGAIAMFFYVGVEVIAGDTIISYGSAQGFALSTATLFASCTLGAMILACWGEEWVASSAYNSGNAAPPERAMTSNEEPNLVKRPRSAIANGQMAGKTRELASPKSEINITEGRPLVKSAPRVKSTPAIVESCNAFSCEMYLGIVTIPMT